MKHIGIYTYLLVTIAIMTSCKESSVYDNSAGNRVIELTTEIGAKQPTTRVALGQKEDSYDMITTWQEGDQVQLVFQQDGHIYDAGTTTIYDITNGGKICKIRMSIPDEIDATKPYLLTGITELKLTDDNGTLCCQSPMIRTRLADFKGRIMFQQELLPGGSRYVRFSNFGTYEVLHVKNATSEAIQFEHCGFEAELKWYHGNETYRFTDGYDPAAYDYSYQSGDAKSTAFTIPAGSTETVVSWYIPSGGFISDATLKTTVNGQSVTSSNKLSSSVPIEARKAYHMFAVWDGKDLKFGKDEPQQQQREAVDLGLPSGTRWATCNVGANSPEEYGEYYAWGETEEKDDYSWKSYKWCNGSSKSITKYCKSVDNKHILDLEDDVAHVKWGGNWRMPTMDECNELEKKCKSRRTTVNGVEGQEIIGPNGNSIFLPAAGRRNNTGFNYVGKYPLYWSSSGLSDSWAHSLRFPYYSYEYSGNWERHYGYPVRPVIK